MLRKVALAGMTAIAAVVGWHWVVPAIAQQHGGYGFGMMSDGMMGGGQQGRGWIAGGGQGFGPGMMGGANRAVTADWGGGVLDGKQAEAFIREGETIGKVDAKAGMVTFSGSDVILNMVAVQPGHDDQTFEVHGLTNPTLKVPVGATVHFNLVNMDYGNNMEHGVIVTRTPPPYPEMAMMAIGPGVASVMPLLPWRSDEDLAKARFASLGATREPGTYWYVCPTPQHAQKGMYGKFVVG